MKRNFTKSHLASSHPSVGRSSMEKGSKSERGDMIINEDTVYTADEESLHPASKEAEPLKDDEALNLDGDPAEYSDEDDDPKNIALNK